MSQTSDYCNEDRNGDEANTFNAENSIEVPIPIIFQFCGKCFKEFIRVPELQKNPARTYALHLARVPHVGCS